MDIRESVDFEFRWLQVQILVLMLSSYFHDFFEFYFP